MISLAATSRRSAGLLPRQSPHSREQTVLWKKIHLNKNQQRVMFLFQLFFAQFDEKILKYNIFKIAQITDGTQFS